MRPAATSWGTYPLLALVKQGADNPFKDGSLHIEAHNSDEACDVFRMYGSGEPGVVPKLAQSSVFDCQAWYRHTISFKASTSTLEWTIVHLDTGTVFYQTVKTGITIKDFDQISIGYQGVAPIYGSWAEIYVDNISLAPEPATPIPELFTMAGLFVGVLGVGGYLRRRFASKAAAR